MKEKFKYLYLGLSYILLDFVLRYSTLEVAGKANFYSSILFSVLYAVLFISIMMLIKNKVLKKVFYGISYYFFMILMIVQYGSQFILHKFLFINDMMLASEGLDYKDYVLGLLTPGLIFVLLLLVVVGVIGIILVPNRCELVRKKKWFICGCSVIGIFITPMTLGEIPDEQKNNFFRNDAYLYDSFDDSNSALHLCGLYQFSVRDLYLTIYDQVVDKVIDYDQYDQMIETFFDERGMHQDNEYTGIFKGKNLIVVMMESIDDFVITKEDTPTLYKLTQEGINFTNFYTPDYSVGYTFNTEFAFNTATYPYRSGNMAFAIADNNFDQAIASKLNQAGYRSRSYHFNSADFYNRGQIHQLFGYEKYVSYQDYDDSFGIIPAVDKFLTQCTPLFEDFISGDPFYSFNISYTAHLPYDNEENGFKQYVLDRFPQYRVQSGTPPINLLRAQAKFTDGMFEDLLVKLEEKGLLEDTVIVGFADHYAYGLSEEDLDSLLEENEIYEKTPAFIYCKGFEGKQVDKVAQTIDLVPTLLNMFGIESDHVMGQDIMDPNYQGYVIFPDLSWMSKDTYYKNDQVVWGDDFSNEEIETMNELFARQQVVNDYILESNYYGRKHE